MRDYPYSEPPDTLLDIASCKSDQSDYSESSMSKSPDTIPLLAEIEAFLADTGMAASTFGQRAIRDWQVVERLRAGGDVTTRKAVAIRAFIASPSARKITPRPRVA